MIILGLNGLSQWGFHDPSACLIVDGRLTHFVEEERLIRIKHAPGLSPKNAAHACLEANGLCWNDIDKIAFGWDLPAFARRVNHSLSRQDLCNIVLNGIGAPYNFPTKRVEFVQHHEAHAWSGLPLTKGSPALVIVVDGQGESESTSVFRYRDTKLELVESYDARFSLGYFFEAVSWYLGLGLKGTGKLMGLAAYGSPPKDLVFQSQGGYGESIASPVPMSLLKSLPGSVDDAKAVVENFWIPYLKDRFPGVKSTIPLISEFAKRECIVDVPDAINAAAFAQANVEAVVSTLISHHLQISDEAIVLTGGVALNCKMNGLISQRFSGLPVHICPTPHDAGTALGAAVRLASEFESAALDMGDFPFTGASFSNEEIEAACAETRVRARKIEKPAEIAASMILSGACVGWFQGAAEVGPRALGARSILACAKHRAVRDHLNKHIKGRESWRPFGPVILDGYQGELFEEYFDAPFMIKSFPLIEAHRGDLGAVVHIDGSTRPQVVPIGEPQHSLGGLLATIHDQGGDPWILNTSFNRAGEPIVYSPRDALETFRRIHLDALFLGDWLVEPSQRLQK